MLHRSESTAAGERVRAFTLAGGLALAVLAWGAPAAARQVIAGLGDDQQVNVRTQGDQFEPRIASDAHGNYAVAWIGSEEAPLLHLHVRLFDSHGVARGGEIQVEDSQLTTDLPLSLRLAMAPDGRFVVVWSTADVRARRFDAQGVALGGSFRIDDVQLRGQTTADVAMADDGRFTVAWSAATGSYSIYLRAYDAAGNPLEAGRRIDAVRPEAHHAPKLATTPEGGVIVVWVRDRTPQVNQVDDQLIAVLRSTWTGNPTPEIVLTPTPHQDLWNPVPQARADGTFSVVWEGFSYISQNQPFDSYKVRALRFDALGGALGPEVTLPFDRPGYYGPAVATDRFGNTLVAISDEEKLEARLFDAAWSPIGESFNLVTYPSDQQYGPVLAVNGDGFVAAWASGFVPPFEWPGPIITQDGDGFGVFARRFAAPLCAEGSKVLCLGANGRFELSVAWSTPAGEHGDGRAHPVTGDTGAFWFFEPSNLELLAKVLDGQLVNGHYWVFSGALSNLESTLQVLDSQTGERRTYHSAQGQLVSRADIEAFTGRAPPPGQAPDPGAAPGLAAPEPAASLDATCADADPAALCLPLAHPFQVSVEFTDPRTGQRGTARPLRLTDNTGAFSFFDPGNLELVLKVLDGRPINQSFWFFYGGLSDVEYTITVRDLATGGVRFYGNARGRLESRVDTDAFRN